MNRLFQAGKMISISDGTLVSPFLNAFDANQHDLPSELLSGMSVAAGQILPGVRSKIHIHPFVSVVTWVLEGELEVRMKGPRDTTSYSLTLRPQQAVLTEARAFFQLINASASVAVSVLYMATPAYVFDLDDGKVIYEDAFVLDDSWEQLEERNWSVSTLANLSERWELRQSSLSRIWNRMRSQSL